jgi:hypothetical protein
VGAGPAGAPRGDPIMVGRGPGDAGEALPPPDDPEDALSLSLAVAHSLVGTGGATGGAPGG